MVTQRVDRRSFLGAAAATPLILGSSGSARPAPSERIQVAFIGTGNQGIQMLNRFLRADLGQVVAVCDVNAGSYGYREPDHFWGREPARELTDRHYAKARQSGSYQGCAAYRDFREVLDRDDVDAIVSVVPDHWHAPITILAAQKGKDIYCEKPLSLTVADGREMVEAVRANNRILQTGSQERSNPVSRFICEAVLAGKIGEVKQVITKVGYNNKVSPEPGWQPVPVPEGFDYRMWLGPAPQRPYHPDRCLYRFRFHYDYSGGQITNFGAHSNDMAHWGLGLDTAGPVEIECLDAKFLPEGSLFNTATETRFRCKYANGVELICESGPESVQTRFEGSEGWLQTGYRGTTASRPELLEGLPKKVDERGFDPHTAHMAKFIECVKSREEPNAPVEVGHASAILCHLANVAIRRFPETGPGCIYRWDDQSERFLDNDEANAMLARPRQSPWNQLG